MNILRYLLEIRELVIQLQVFYIPAQFCFLDAISLFQRLFRRRLLQILLDYSLLIAVLLSINNAKLLEQIPHFPKMKVYVMITTLHTNDDIIMNLPCEY